MLTVCSWQHRPHHATASELRESRRRSNIDAAISTFQDKKVDFVYDLLRGRRKATREDEEQKLWYKHVDEAKFGPVG